MKGGKAPTCRDIEDGINTCAKCGKPATEKCGDCKKIFYCSKECQSTDWKKHKHQCNPILKDADVTSFLTWLSKEAGVPVRKINFGLLTRVISEFDGRSIMIDDYKYIRCTSLKEFLSLLITGDTINFDCAMAAVVVCEFITSSSIGSPFIFPFPLLSPYKKRAFAMATTWSKDPSSFMREPLSCVSFALQWIIPIGEGKYWGMTTKGMKEGTQAHFGRSLVNLHKQLGESSEIAKKVLAEYHYISEDIHPITIDSHGGIMHINAQMMKKKGVECKYVRL